MNSQNDNLFCSVCGSEDLLYFGLLECNHHTCGKCSIKLRYLELFSTKFDTKSCDYSKCVTCRNDNKEVIICKNLRKFEDFNLNNLLFNDVYRLYFDSKESLLFFKSVLEVKCKTCNEVFPSHNGLVQHISEHNLEFCNLCVKFELCLPSEFVPVTEKELNCHILKSHPICDFCETHHYNQDHLVTHVKNEHFICDICQPLKGLVAYPTQEKLLEHFNRNHFVCEICRSENKINAFQTSQDLKMHKVIQHKETCLVQEGLIKVEFNNEGRRYANPRFAHRNYNSRNGNNVNRDREAETISENATQENNAISSNNDVEDVRQAFNSNVDITSPVLFENEFPTLTRAASGNAISNYSVIFPPRSFANDFPTLRSVVTPATPMSFQNLQFKRKKITKSTPLKTSGTPGINSKSHQLMKSSMKKPATNQNDSVDYSSTSLFHPKMKNKKLIQNFHDFDERSNSNLSNSEPAAISKISVIPQNNFNNQEIKTSQKLPKPSDFPALPPNARRNSNGTNQSTKLSFSSVTSNPAAAKSKTVANPLNFPDYKFDFPNSTKKKNKKR